MVLQKKKNDSNYVSGSASGLGSADGGGDASKTDDPDVNAVNSNDNMTDRNLSNLEAGRNRVNDATEKKMTVIMFLVPLLA